MFGLGPCRHTKRKEPAKRPQRSMYARHPVYSDKFRQVNQVVVRVWRVGAQRMAAASGAWDFLSGGFLLEELELDRGCGCMVS